MAPRKPGRKAAKSEVAQGLLNALAFVGVTKKPTETSLPYVSHVWLNSGYAIAFDGVIAAGHPIDAGIAGYPNTKLLIEALENCGKQFDLTVRETGAFEIKSGTYQSLVPAAAYNQVVPTPPDAKTHGLDKRFVDSMATVAKVVSDTAPKLVYASIRLSGNSVMATNGNTIIEGWHGIDMPIGVLVPKAFAVALDKAANDPVGFGVAPDFSSLTVWFENGSWVRTQTYSESWPDEILQAFPNFFVGVNSAEVPKGFFDAVRLVAPFMAEDGRIIIRPGIVQTHMDKRFGAAVEIPTVNFGLDIDGKSLLAVEDMVAHYGIGSLSSDTGTFVFYNATTRGVIAGMASLPEVAPAPASPPMVGGWTTTPAPTPSPQDAAAPWGEASAPAFIAPPSDAAPQQQQAAPAFRTAEMQRDPNKVNGWDSPPPEGLLQDASFRDQAGLPAMDTGVNLGGWGMPAEEMQDEFSPGNVEFDPAAWGAAQAAPAPVATGWNIPEAPATPPPPTEGGFGAWLGQQKDINE